MEQPITQFILELAEIAHKKGDILTSDEMQKEISLFSETNLKIISVDQAEDLAQLIAVFSNMMRLRSESDFINKSIKSVLKDLSEALYGKGAKPSKLTSADCQQNLAKISALIPVEVDENTFGNYTNAKDFFQPFVNKYIESKSSLKSVLSFEHAGEFLMALDLNAHGPFSIASGITTHPVKFDERVRVSDNLFFITEKSENPHGASGSSEHLTKSITISTNAGWLSHRFLLVLEYKYKGKKTSFVEMILNNDPALDLALGYLIKDNDSISEIKALVKSGIGNLSSAVGKQVYFPVISNETGLLDYDLLTPVISAGFQRELTSELIHSLKNNEMNEIFYYPTSESSVGGTQPQNTSYLNSKLGGINTMLKFTMPPTSELNAIEKILYSKNTLFHEPRVLPKELMSKTVHHKFKSAFEKAICSWCLDATSFFDQYKQDIQYYIEKDLRPTCEIEWKVVTDTGLSISEQLFMTTKLNTLLIKSMSANKAPLTLEVREMSLKLIKLFVGRCF